MKKFILWIALGVIAMVLLGAYHFKVSRKLGDIRAAREEVLKYQGQLEGYAADPNKVPSKTQIAEYEKGKNKVQIAYGEALAALCKRDDPLEMFFPALEGSSALAKYKRYILCQWIPGRDTMLQDAEFRFVFKDPYYVEAWKLLERKAKEKLDAVDGALVKETFGSDTSAEQVRWAQKRYCIQDELIDLLAGITLEKRSADGTTVTKDRVVRRLEAIKFEGDRSSAGDLKVCDAIPVVISADMKAEEIAILLNGLIRSERLLLRIYALEVAKAETRTSESTTAGAAAGAGAGVGKAGGVKEEEKVQTEPEPSAVEEKLVRVTINTLILDPRVAFLKASFGKSEAQGTVSFATREDAKKWLESFKSSPTYQAASTGKKYLIDVLYDGINGAAGDFDPEHMTITFTKPDDVDQLIEFSLEEAPIKVSFGLRKQK